MGFIYRIINGVTIKIYIGQTTKPIRLRWKKHRDSAKAYSKYITTGEHNGTSKYIKHSAIYAAMHKYGLKNFRIEIILECANEDLDKLETQYIKDLNTLAPNGYNLTTGGTDGHQLTEEAKRE